METSIYIFVLCCLTPCLTYDIKALFEDINKETGNFDAIGAEIAWDSLINPGKPEIKLKSYDYQKNRIVWQHRICDKLATLFNSQMLNDTQKRQSYLLCRGKKFTFKEARLASSIYNELQSIYSDAEVCIPSDKNATFHNITNVEDAILNYLSKMERFLRILKNEHEDPSLMAAKIAVYGEFGRKGTLCLKGENDFEKIMAFSKNEEVLRWTWLVWRERVGPPMKEPFKRLVNVENLIARRNGYQNIGAVWRDELEIPNLRQLCRHLYDSIKPLYKLLHGVVRFYLRRYYGDMVPERGPIPAHLLGNLWSQNWEPLVDILLPNNLDLDKSIQKLNWTVEYMVKRVDDFYQSMNLPAMTDVFWRESVFSQEQNKKARCHGTAADMFKNGDYRLLYCSGTTKEDFYVLHHEIGHIQYYMAYAHQPSLFRQANAAFHEAIGDAIMYGVLTPQHLNRLNLINDTLLYMASDTNITEDTNENDNAKDFFNINELAKHTDTTDSVRKLKINRYDTNDHQSSRKVDDQSEKIYDKNVEISILKTRNGINKLGNAVITKFKGEINNGTKILNSIVIDPNYDATNALINKIEDIKLFDEDSNIDTVLLLRQALNKIPQIPFALLIDEYRWKYFEGSLKNENGDFWDMVIELQGVASPVKRGEEYFDAGAKFHVPDNTPYIRYFLSSFLQYQIFESLCKAATFGRRNADEPLPKTIAVHRCDLYGSKSAGKILKDIMSRGHSQHWSEILQATIGENTISASALHRYYRPLYKKLKKFVHKHNIPVGW